MLSILKRVFKRKWGFIKTLKTLHDNSNDIYVWIVNENEQPHVIDELRMFINTTYQEMYGHEPRALHIVVQNIKDIHHMDKETFLSHVKPYLRD